MDLKKTHYWQENSFFKPARRLFEKQTDVDVDPIADTERIPEPEEAPVTERVPTYTDRLTDPIAAPDTERETIVYGKPEIDSQFRGFREKVGTTLEDKKRRIAELEALLAEQEERHKKELAEQEEKHQIELREERERGLIDTLTGLHNRRFFNERVEDIARLALRQNTSFSILFIDLDKFKVINDVLGHQGGDEALKKVSQIIRDTLRPEDEKFRYGGEELVILLPGINKVGAKAAAERLRLAIQTQLLPHLREKYGDKVDQLSPETGEKIMGTASIGTSTHEAKESENKARGPESRIEAEELAEKKTIEADQAAYTAKELGRNETVSFGEEIPQQAIRGKMTERLKRSSSLRDRDSLLEKIREEITDPVELEKTLREAADMIKKEYNL